MAVVPISAVVVRVGVTRIGPVRIRVAVVRGRIPVVVWIGVRWRWYWYRHWYINSKSHSCLGLSWPPGNQAERDKRQQPKFLHISKPQPRLQSIPCATESSPRSLWVFEQWVGSKNRNLHSRL